MLPKEFGTGPDNLLPSTFRLSKRVKLLGSNSPPDSWFLDKSMLTRFASLPRDVIEPSKLLLLKLIDA